MTVARPAFPSADERGTTDSCLGLLASGVPLSLLLDLAAAVPSRELFRDEPADTRWLESLSA